MNQAASLALVVAAILASNRSAWSQELTPPGLQPAWRVILVADDGDLEVTVHERARKNRTEQYVVEVPIKEARIVDGERKVIERKVKETRTRTVVEYVNELRTRREKDFQIRQLDGERILIKNFPKNKKQAAIILRGSGKLDPFFAKILKPDTIVVTILKSQEKKRIEGDNRRVIMQPPPPVP